MRVLAAMSGGVDSAVAAARAVEAGHEVVGVHLALSRAGGTLRTGSRGCCTIEDAMDARRAAPLNNDVASVTVLAPDCMSADAWATALLVAGPGAGLALAQRHRLEALWLVQRDGRLVEVGLGRFGSAGVPAGD